MKFILLTLTFCCGLNYLSAQKYTGFYGKRFFVGFSVLGNNPAIYNFFFGANAAKASGSTLVSSTDKFNFGWRASIGYAVKRNFAVGCEFGQYYSSAYLQDDHEMLDVRTTSIIPTLEFATSNALLPMGLSHQFGFGISLSSVVDRVYLHGPYYNDVLDYAGQIKNQTPLMKGVIMYGLNIRTPISKSLLISYGFKYTIHFARNYKSSEGSFNPSHDTGVKDEVNYQQRFNFINLTVGLTYSF